MITGLKGDPGQPPAPLGRGIQTPPGGISHLLIYSHEDRDGMENVVTPVTISWCAQNPPLIGIEFQGPGDHLLEGCW